MIGLSRKMPLLAGLGLCLTLAACGGDDIEAPTPTPTTSPTPGPTPSPTPPAADCPADFANGGVIAGKRNCILPNQIIRNLTVPSRAGTVYSLSGRVVVGRDIGGDGQASGGIPVTLTVDPGVVIFGSGGLDYLLVNRGSKLQAAGTAAAPIIFTSRANLEGLSTDSSQGQWGGIIVLGRAPISDCLGGVAGGSANCEQTFEGLTDALYGGAVANDSSGTLQYIQIRYAGFELFPNQEINGLTLAGAGSGTVVDHMQVHNSSDDGIEIFGGRVNAKYLVLTGNDDDSLDTDQGYQGFIQFVIAAQKAGGGSGDDMIEADSDGADDSLPRQWTRLANATLIHRSTRANSAVLLRGGTDFSLVNSIIVSQRACIDIDGSATVRSADGGLQDQGPPVFRSVTLSCAGGAYLNDGDVAPAAIQGLFESAVLNNNPALASSLSNTFVNGPNEASVPAFNASTLGNFLVATSYIGAVKDATDLWFRGWTCDSAAANFGSNAGCNVVQYR